MWQTVKDFMRSHPQANGTQLYIDVMGVHSLIGTVRETETKFFQGFGKGAQTETVLRIHIPMHPKYLEVSLGSLSTGFRLADRAEVQNVLNIHALSAWMEEVICGRP